MSGQKPREIADRVLLRHSTGGEYVEKLLEEELARSRLAGADRGLCQELVFGVVRWQAALDWLITRKTAGRRQKLPLQILLRLGLYQIFWLDRIPNHAAVHETVEQAKHAGFGPQGGFVNAVLRGYLREFEATQQALAGLKTTQPHLGYSHPEWLVARWQQRWGAERAAQLMDWNNTPPTTYARLNTLKLALPPATPWSGNSSGTRPSAAAKPAPGAEARARENPGRTLKDEGDVLAMWRDENVEYDFFRRDWFGENMVFELKSYPPLTGLATFQRGLFYVQDPSTLLAVSELNPQPGEAVLDLCAAPGGKATYIAQRMQDRGRLVAHDTSPDRARMIQDNVGRLGITCVETICALGPQRSAFDRILVDAPCSNTGVMRRRIDLRWRIRPTEIQRLQSEQVRLLHRAAGLVKAGGTLVYSTCSLEPEENRAVIEQFRHEHAEFNLQNERQLLPFADGVDGAYVARLERKGKGKGVRAD